MARNTRRAELPAPAGDSQPGRGGPQGRVRVRVQRAQPETAAELVQASRRPRRAGEHLRTPGRGYPVRQRHRRNRFHLPEAEALRAAPPVDRHRPGQAGHAAAGKPADRRRVEHGPVQDRPAPIPITELEPLEELRRLLHEHRAEGTRASLLYMFGLHINPESPRVDAPTLLNYLRSFVLLYRWLEEDSRVDLTRRLGPYINSFPPEYARLILADDYPATPDRLIDDYVRSNPTRNRPLDMLPILACLDRERFRRSRTHISPSRGRRSTIGCPTPSSTSPGFARRRRAEYAGSSSSGSKRHRTD